MDIENMEYENSEDDGEEQNHADIKLPPKKNLKIIENEEDDDSDIDEETKRINRMAADVDSFYK